MDKELINEIDKLIKELIEVGIIVQTKDTSETTNKAIRYLKANGFLNSSKTGFKPTGKVYDSVDMGIEKYLKNKRNNDNSTNVTPITKPETKSLFKKIYSSPWILLIVGSVITAILNAKKIKDWIDTLF